MHQMHQIDVSPEGLARQDNVNKTQPAGISRLTPAENIPDGVTNRRAKHALAQGPIVTAALTNCSIWPIVCLVHLVLYL